jgi:hypothetical protein
MPSDILSFLFAWYNLPFTILILLGLLMAALQLIGLGGDDDGDSGAHVDHDMDMDHSVDLDHSLDLDHSVDLDHSLDLDHGADLDQDVSLDHSLDMDHNADLDHAASVEHDADADHAGMDVGERSLSFLSLLAFIGVGKAPLMVVLLILFFAMGSIGWVLNGIATRFFSIYPALCFVGVLPGAIGAGAMVSSRAARAIGRALPPVSTTAMRAQEMVGMRGVVVSPYVDERYGQIRLRTPGGTLITVFGVTSAPEPIHRGEPVVLVSYNESTKMYHVVSASS